MEQVITGTWDEIKSHESELVGHNLMVIIDPVEPPNTYHNQEELEALLERGFRGEPHKVTPESWEADKQELRRRREARNQS
jgi:hypothetical protein